MASRSVNKVILIGHLGKDAETRYTTGGTPRTTFTLATNYRWKDAQTGEWKEETEWHNIVLWRQENLGGFLTKGRQVYVEGRIQTRTYEKDGQKRSVTEIVAQDVLFLGGRGAEIAGAEDDAAQGPARGAQRPAAAPAAEPFSEGITDDDVPF